MTWKLHKNKTAAFMAFGLFMVIGTYNAVVINSESHLAGTDIKFVKRLDEIYGVTVSGREVAASMNWQKLSPQQVAVHKNKVRPRQLTQTVSTSNSAPEVSAGDIVPAAAVQEELSLNLVEVINPKKWQKGLTNTQFNGSLATNNGVIESLSVSLPNGEGVSVSFSEMVGNVFEYDLDGELYSGMMYQIDQGAYMVTLTNGPLEGTRLRFLADAPAVEQQQNQEILAENNGIEVGNFGQDPSLDQPIEQNQNQEFVQAEEVQDNNLQDQQMQQQPFNEEQAMNYDQSLQQQQQF
ncbi:hypothetical protein [Peredibacter starrii]|uniref:SAF domain-containing protein n=1 Tax=Peredibacter starrii TaxID=28202 RepID=A0AAX4HQ55_9BACT|nr:hypothetical protein [Peredibacter starrii]WPU65345.1 hypothetical protein SOO65_01130 [Peredibacter starrii]